MKLSRILIAIIACSSYLLAQEAAAPAAAAPATEAKAPVAKKAAVPNINGTIVSIDANTIIVKTKKGEDTLAVDAAAKVILIEKKPTVADLKADMNVSVASKVVAGKKVATKITEKTAPAAEKKAAAAPAAAAPAATPAAAPAATPAEKKIEAAATAGEKKVEAAATAAEKKAKAAVQPAVPVKK